MISAFRTSIEVMETDVTAVARVLVDGPDPKCNDISPLWSSNYLRNHGPLHYLLSALREWYEIVLYPARWNTCPDVGYVNRTSYYSTTVVCTVIVSRRAAGNATVAICRDPHMNTVSSTRGTVACSIDCANHSGLQHSSLAKTVLVGAVT